MQWMGRCKPLSGQIRFIKDSRYVLCVSLCVLSTQFSVDLHQHQDNFTFSLRWSEFLTAPNAFIALVGVWRFHLRWSDFDGPQHFHCVKSEFHGSQCFHCVGQSLMHSLRFVGVWHFHCVSQFDVFIALVRVWCFHALIRVWRFHCVSQSLMFSLC